jgi:hypothetical protein
VIELGRHDAWQANLLLMVPPLGEFARGVKPVCRSPPPAHETPNGAAANGSSGLIPGTPGRLPRTISLSDPATVGRTPSSFSRLINSEIGVRADRRNGWLRPAAQNALATSRTSPGVRGLQLPLVVVERSQQLDQLRVKRREEVRRDQRRKGHAVWVRAL